MLLSFRRFKAVCCLFVNIRPLSSREVRRCCCCLARVRVFVVFCGIWLLLFFNGVWVVVFGRVVCCCKAVGTSCTSFVVVDLGILGLAFTFACTFLQRSAANLFHHLRFSATNN